MIYFGPKFFLTLVEWLRSLVLPLGGYSVLYQNSCVYEERFCVRRGNVFKKFFVYFASVIKMGTDKNNEDVIIKVNKWDSCAVKNALDDAVKCVLTKKYNYIENFALLNGRLALCGIAITLAIIALLYDYLYPFPASKPVLIACVSLYFFLMGLLTLYITYKEKGIFVVAVQRDPAGFNPDLVWEASSYLNKEGDKYNLVLSVRNTTTGLVNETNITKSVANFIDINGVVIPELIETVVTNMHDSLASQRKEK